MSRLLQNLRAGWRFALFRRVAADGFDFSLDQVVALALFDLLLLVAVARLDAPEPAAFNPAAVGQHLQVLALVLLGVFFGARPGAGAQGVLRVVVVMLAAAPIFYLLPVVLSLAEERTGVVDETASYWGHWLVYGWSVLTDLRAFALALGERWARALARFLPYAALAVAPAYLMPNEPYWVEGAEPGEQRPLVDAERVFYDQPDRLRAALAGLEPQRRGVADLYFVGFGAYAHEDVFMREVRFARSVLERRYGTQGRSLLLLNNPLTVGEAPIASRTNLSRVLDHLGHRVMDPREDVLFLFLSSHGEPGELTVDFWPLSLNVLRAEDLKSMLDAAGIRWRVVVVSACYSGGFIDALRDDNTLVITAARGDRASFGCSHEADLTYFGRAFFAEQLPRARSLAEAFRGAAASVAAREEKERREHSEPQMYAGPAILAKLGEIEGRAAGQALALDHGAPANLP